MRAAAPETAADQRLRPDRVHDVHLPTQIPRDLPAIDAARSRSAARSPTRSVHVLNRALRAAAGRRDRRAVRRRRGLARGYLKRPELTAERFVADPFGAPGERLTAPATRCAGATTAPIEFVGRTDGQVKIRGYPHRVGRDRGRAGAASRRAVRARSWRAPTSPATSAWSRTSWPRREPPSATALRAHLAARLPDFMVPARYVRLGRAAGDRERQARPPRAAGAGPQPSRTGGRPSSPPSATETPHVRGLCGRCSTSTGVGRTRQLLRARRQLAAGRCACWSNLQRAAWQSRRTPVPRRRRTDDAVAEPDPGDARGGARRRACRDTRGAGSDRAAHDRGTDEPIAIVAMAGRFPGAADVEALLGQPVRRPRFDHRVRARRARPVDRPQPSAPIRPTCARAA